MMKKPAIKKAFITYYLIRKTIYLPPDYQSGNQYIKII